MTERVKLKHQSTRKDVKKAADRRMSADEMVQLVTTRRRVLCSTLETGARPRP